MKSALFVACTFLLSSSLLGESPKKLTWTTADGVKLVGRYYPASKPKAATWVLLHGLGSTKDEWNDFSAQLTKQGNGVFTYDARGHGESIQKISGENFSYKEWQSTGPGTPWDSMAADLASAVQLLYKTHSVPEKKIAVGGASLGANVALLYASQHPLVPGLVLLSPGMDYAGIPAAQNYKAYQGRPVFIAASSGDLYAFSSVRQLSNLASSQVQVIAEAKSGHGVQMFDDKPFVQKLLTWISSVDK